jgi:hypothetical protein
MKSKCGVLGLYNTYPTTFRAFRSTLKNVSFLVGRAEDNPEIFLTVFRIALNPGSVRIELKNTMHIQLKLVV